MLVLATMVVGVGVAYRLQGVPGKGQRERFYSGIFQSRLSSQYETVQSCWPAHSDPSGKAKFILVVKGFIHLTSGWSHAPQVPKHCPGKADLGQQPRLGDCW